MIDGTGGKREEEERRTKEMDVRGSAAESRRSTTLTSGRSDWRSRGAAGRAGVEFRSAVGDRCPGMTWLQEPPKPRRCSAQEPWSRMGRRWDGDSRASRGGGRLSRLWQGQGGRDQGDRLGGGDAAHARGEDSHLLFLSSLASFSTLFPPFGALKAFQAMQLAQQQVLPPPPPLFPSLFFL